MHICCKCGKLNCAGFFVFFFNMSRHSTISSSSSSPCITEAMPRLSPTRWHMLKSSTVVSCTCNGIYGCVMLFSVKRCCVLCKHAPFMVKSGMIRQWRCSASVVINYTPANTYTLKRMHASPTIPHCWACWYSFAPWKPRGGKCYTAWLFDFDELASWTRQEAVYSASAGFAHELCMSNEVQFYFKICLSEAHHIAFCTNREFMLNVLRGLEWFMGWFGSVS